MALSALPDNGAGPVDSKDESSAGVATREPATGYPEIPFLRVDDSDWEPWDPDAYAGKGNVELHYGSPQVKWLRFRESGGTDIGTGTALLKGGLWRSNGPVHLQFHVFADEMILCLTGEARIEVLTTGEILTIRPGDVISLPKGWDMIWTMSPDYVELYESADA